MKSSATALAVLALIFLLRVDAGLYTRWGRTSCPPDNSIVYTGYMVTDHEAATGGGHNILCAADHPEWVGLNQNDAINRGSGLHGMHYFFGPGYSNNLPFSYENNNNQKLDNYTAPCFLCYTPRSDVAMITGLFNCPGDMTAEYSGLITANHWKVETGEFICLDQAPETRGKDVGIARFDIAPAIAGARFICGTLPCEEYNPNSKYAHSSCAVCSI